MQQSSEPPGTDGANDEDTSNADAAGCASNVTVVIIVAKIASCLIIALAAVLSQIDF